MIGLYNEPIVNLKRNIIEHIKNIAVWDGLSIEIIGYRYEENTISESLNLK